MDNPLDNYFIASAAKQALSHCVECNLWLRGDQGCEHIAPRPLDNARGNGPESDRAAASLDAPFHAAGDIHARP